MALLTTAKPLPACPKLPPPLPVPDGTALGSSDCGRHRVRRVLMAGDPKVLRCAIYTRKSTEHGLELEFNSLHAQRDACEAYIKSQASQGWKALHQHYDDPAYSGGNLDRPALQQLLKDIDAGRIDVIVVYKIDRLTRSLPDFAKLVEAFDAKSISFVAVTQQFNTTTSMGRLTLNVLLSFAQFERELSSERVRDKVAAPGARANGWAARCPSAMTPRTRSWSSTRPRQRPSDTSSSATWNCRVLESWWKISTKWASSPSGGTQRSKKSTAGFPSPTVPSPISSKIGFTLARPVTRTNGSPASMRPLSNARPSIRSKSFSHRNPPAERPAV